jgi:hypothetical protein
MTLDCGLGERSRYTGNSSGGCAPDSSHHQGAYKNQ